jgi:CubicO group peptidase (beta-lactamase class C family)
MLRRRPRHRALVHPLVHVLGAAALLLARPASSQTPAAAPAASAPAASAPAASAPTASGATARAALVARLDSLATAFLREGPAAGVTVGVVRGADTLVLRGYGWADTSARRAAGPATVYRTGSITKQFTAAAVLQLVGQKRLSLDDTLGRFLPQYPQWGRITIRQLLNHTSGIPSYTGNAAWRARLAEPLAPDTVLGFVARDSFDFAPGTQFRYNNTGYFLLGRVLERVTKTPYPELVRRQFFQPLGMRSAAYCPDAPRDSVFAAGYDRQGSRYAPAAPLSMTSPYAAGALCMSVPDFLRWQAALTSGRVVPPAVYARMSRSDTLSDGKASGYGWGLAPMRVGTHAAVQHGGAINGFATQQLWLPDDSLRVVVFANTGGSPTDRLAYNLAAVVVGEPLRAGPKPLVAVPLPATVRDAAVGRYLLALGTRTLALTLRAEGEGLVGQAEGQGTIPLLYLGDDTFGASFDPAMRLTLVREGGRVVRVTLLQGGATVDGPRQP